MKQFIFYFLLIVSAQSFATAEKYVLEPDHSYVTWHVNHFGFSNVSGSIDAQGTIMLDEAALQNSAVNITLNIASLETPSLKFTDTLKSGKFFNASSFPNATFVSNSITMTGKNTAKVSGTLTIHGVSKPVVLNARINKIGMHSYYGVKAAGFSAAAIIKRSDFGLGAFTPGVSDEVKVDIEVEAKKAS
ncbi:MAG: YceI family protein [Proteobacteria bacterium]|nr:YceI family protein [Pseudomonadota bacterium]